MRYHIWPRLIKHIYYSFYAFSSLLLIEYFSIPILQIKSLYLGSLKVS